MSRHTDVRDVVLHQGPLPHRDGRIEWPTHKKEPVEIAPHLWLGPLREAEAIMVACLPRGERFPRPVINIPVHYAMYRTGLPSDASRYGFDEDGRLRTAMQLSRIVRPTSLAYSPGARVRRGKGTRREINPFRVLGPGAATWVLDEDQNCLWDDDADELRRLIVAFRPKQLPVRIRRALWYHEYMHWMQLGDVRLPMLATALEALVHTSDRGHRGKRLGSTDQFVMRLDKLRGLVPGVKWRKSDLDVFYSHRSQLVHGQGAGRLRFSQRGRAVAARLEYGLRFILRESIHSRHVADIFRSDASVRTTLGF
jgi:hypothetical protein